MATSTIERPAIVPSLSAIDSKNLGVQVCFSRNSSRSEDFGSMKLAERQRSSEDVASHRLRIVGAPARFNRDAEYVVRPVTLDISQMHPELGRAERRLLEISKLDVTQGLGHRISPTRATIAEAGVVLRKFAALGSSISLPDIGLDSDGMVVLSFHPSRGAVVGSLAVYGDGTYSYSLENGPRTAESGEAQVSASLPDDLISLFLE